jgi:hypothetical protein
MKSCSNIISAQGRSPHVSHHQCPLPNHLPGVLSLTLALQYCPSLTYAFSVVGLEDAFSLGLSCDTAMVLVPEAQWTPAIPRPLGTYSFSPVKPLITGGQYCVYVRATGFKNVLEQAASNQHVRVSVVHGPARLPPM